MPHPPAILRTASSCLLRPGASLLDRPRPVVEQWAVDKARPAVQDRDHLARQIAETPATVGIDRQRLVVAFERVVEIDHPADETGREYTDAAEIEQVDGAVLGDGVVAEMRVAVNDAVMVEWHVPGPEHALRDLVSVLQRRF